MTLNAFLSIILHGKCRPHSAVGVEDVTLNFNVDLICGRWKCSYLGYIVEVSKMLLANQDLRGYG